MIEQQGSGLEWEICCGRVINVRSVPAIAKVMLSTKLVVEYRFIPSVVIWFARASISQFNTSHFQAFSHD